MTNVWFRLWHELANDPKWRTISRVSNQPISLVIALYIHLLTNASMSPERGVLHNFSNEDVASALDVTASDVAAIVTAMQGRVLDGTALTGWDRRQPKREDGSAERAGAWRERKRATTKATERERTQPNAGEHKQTEATGTEHNGTADTDTDTEQKRNLVRRGKRDADSRHKVFRDIVAEYWAANNHSDMPWDASDAKQLSSFLSANPSIDALSFRDLIANRQKSQVNHSERLRAWIARATDYTAGPLNAFNRPMETPYEGRLSKSQSTLAALKRSMAPEPDQDLPHETGNSQGSSDWGGGVRGLLEGPGPVSPV